MTKSLSPWVCNSTCTRFRMGTSPGHTESRRRELLEQIETMTEGDDISVGVKELERFFFRPTPYGSRQVVKQAGKPVAYFKFSELVQWQHH